MKKNKTEKKNSNLKKDCPFFDTCKTRLHPFAATDEPNLVAHLGWRVAYTFLAWLVLGLNINSGFLLAALFFILPIFMDCLKFYPLNNLRKKIRIAEIIILSLFNIIPLLGILGICKLEESEGLWFIVLSENFIIKTHLSISVECFWKLLGLVVGVTIVDWLCNGTRLDCAQENT